MAMIWRSFAIVPVLFFPVGKTEPVLLAAVSQTFPESGISSVKFGSYTSPLWQSLSQITALVQKDLIEQRLFLCHISTLPFTPISFPERSCGQFPSDLGIQLGNSRKAYLSRASVLLGGGRQQLNANWGLCIGIFLGLA